MARHINLIPAPTFRAVILMRFSGAHGMDLKTYTMGDGTRIQYHRADAYGPYASKAQATSQITRETKFAREYGLWINGVSNRVKPDIDAFVETSTPVWTKV